VGGDIVRKTYLTSEEDYFSPAPEHFKETQARTEALGFRTSLFQLGESKDTNPPVALMLYLPPGGVLFRHRHDCHRMEVVVQGSMQTEEGLWLNPGDVRLSNPGEFYGPHTAGPTGVLSVEIFSSTAGVASEMHPDLPPEHRAMLEASRARALAAQAAKSES
jgi:hypothetical protein